MRWYIIKKVKRIINYNDEKYPKRLLKIKKFPPKLYCVGNIDLLNADKIIAIVGSRDCSKYGKIYAQIFANQLANENICIVSGLAIGIDAAAHMGAMKQKGKTIAVIPGGINKIYPKENIELFKSIIKNGGCIITEHDDYEETIMKDFIKRNRIISGIADATLVIECKNRSGTTSTARLTMEQNKKVYCIPHSIDSKIGIGVNELISKGAIGIMSAKQIINDLYEKNQSNFKHQELTQEYENFNKTENANKNNQFNKSNEPQEIKNEIYKVKLIRNINENYKIIYEELMRGNKTREELSQNLKMPIAEINYKLTMMEIEGYISKQEGNKFSVQNE